MNKERLEEIKQEVELLRDDMCVTSIEVDTSADVILDDMVWLIERAQELKELEKAFDELDSSYVDLQEENQRYREALEEISRKRIAYADMAGAIRIARQVLEGE